MTDLFIERETCPSPGRQQEGVNCLSCWDENRFFLACFGCLLLRYLRTGGPHKETYGLQHQLVNKSYGTAGSLAS